MKPRWNADTWTREDLTYLGGTNEFDLWVDEDMEVRVVWGTTEMEWDFFYWSKQNEEYEWGSEDYPTKDRNAVLVEALTYLRCFAPWVEQEMTKTYKIRRTTWLKQ